MEKILKILLFLPILALSTKAEWVVKSYQEIKNERVIRQTYEQSCGASSLATLLNILDDQKKVWWTWTFKDYERTRTLYGYGKLCRFKRCSWKTGLSKQFISNQ